MRLIGLNQLLINSLTYLNIFSYLDSNNGDSARHLARVRLSLLKSLKNRNTKVRKLKVESTLSISLKNSLLSINNIVTLVRIIKRKRVLLLVSQKRKLGLSTRLDTLEGQRNRNVSALGGVVRSTLPDKSTLVLVLASNVVKRVEVGGGGESMGHGVSGEEGPDVPAGRAGSHGGIGGELDHGDGPLPAVLVLEDRSVESSGDAIGIALIAAESDGLADTRDPPGVRHQITTPASSTVGVSRSDLTNDMTILVVIKQVKLFNKSVRLTVRMIITDSRSRNVETSILLITDGVDRSTRGDNGEIRMSLLNSIKEHGETVLLVRVPAGGITSEPILVSDLNVGESERLGVTKLSTLLAPLGSDGTSNKFDLVEGVVDERLKLVLGGDGAIQRKTSVDTDNCRSLAAAQSIVSVNGTY
jgi:hypothetical protein